MVRRMPPKKLHPSNLLPLFPEGSTGVVEITGDAVVTGEVFSVVVEVLIVEVVGLAVEVVEAVVLSVVVVEVEVEAVVVLVDVAEVLGVEGEEVEVSFSGVKLVLNFGGI